ncbi:MAG: nitroreductase family protein [Ardenticatenaceae bacterium]
MNEFEFNFEEYETMMEIARRRRSVRKFEPGRKVPREVLLKIMDAGRWSPSGANSQPWDFICVDDEERKMEVREVFLRQAERLRTNAERFPAVRKEYMANTVAIILVIGDPRWTKCYPQGRADIPGQVEEYAENNEYIYLASLGSAVQMISMAVASVGLTSAWLSGGGEETTNRELSQLLGYPSFMRAYATIPIGYPVKGVKERYRRPLEQVVHWNGYNPEQYRPDDLVDFYINGLRAFAMYRDSEEPEDWKDADQRLGKWKEAFTGRVTNPSGQYP